jgi:serine/threonine protein kinase
MLRKEIKLGEGTYGTVYSASFHSDNLKTKIAYKRNFSEKSASWMWNVRELNLLATLKGHPFIVELLDVSFTDPMSKDNPLSPSARSKQVRDGMKEDKLHFVLEYVPISGNNIVYDRTLCTPKLIKIMSVQLLIAVEYMHSQGIIHRDLKPANLLLSDEEKEGPRLRVCDFGMGHMGNSSNTPGVVTSWYRAPEIACRWKDYTSITDIWSVGCILYELCSGAAYLQGVKDNDNDIISAIFGRSPRDEKENAGLLFSRGETLSLNGIYFEHKRKTLLTRMKLSTKFVTEFNSTLGSISEFEDLLGGLLEVNPYNRLTATSALEHPFFEDFRSYITDIRSRFVPLKPSLPAITILDSVERKWMIRTASKIYNERNKLAWYTHEILFHAIDLFDRYLEAVNSGKIPPILSTTQNKQHTEVEFYACIHLMYKYYTTITYPLSWEQIVPFALLKYDYTILAEKFEMNLITSVTNFCFYRETLLEMAVYYNTPLTEELVLKLMIGYGAITSWSKKSARSLYRSIVYQQVPVSG